MKIFLFTLFNSIAIFTYPTYCVAFDQNHCKRKCESLFSDSPTKKSLCLGTCSNGFFEREKIVYKYENINKKNSEKITKCLENCSINVNSATDFKAWTKCRKSCVLSDQIKSSQQQNYIPFGLDECNSECDRYWKGTVHWEPCQQQCQKFIQKYSDKRKENNDESGNDLQNSQKKILYNVW